LATNCEECGRRNVEVDLNVGGEPLVMRSCSFCDRREWVGPDGVLDLSSVLDTVQTEVGR
jgi:hypothetical protein